MRLKHSNCPVGCGDKLVLVFDHWVGFWLSEDKTQIQKHTLNCSMMVILNVPISTLISHDIIMIRIPSRTTMALDYCPLPSYVNFWGLHNFATHPKIKYKINKTEWTQTKLQLQLFSEVGWLVLAAVLHYFAPDLSSVKKLAFEYSAFFCVCF